MANTTSTPSPMSTIATAADNSRVKEMPSLIECPEMDSSPVILDTNQIIKPLKNHGFNMIEQVLNSDTQVSPGVVLIEPIQLFNILMQMEQYPCVSDPNYLILLDTRRRETYDESHIILARYVPRAKSGDYNLPFGCDIDMKRNIVVYDGITDLSTFLTGPGQKIQSDAHHLADYLWDRGSRNPVQILRGGYMVFSKLYPFLRTNHLISLPRELDNFYTYPTELFPGKLYLGRWQHSSDAKIIKDLKIDAIVNLCRGKLRSIDMSQFEREKDNVLYKAEASEYKVLHVPGADNHLNADIYSRLDEIIAFINMHKCVLVISRYGLSRSVTVCLAYLMSRNRLPLKKAYLYCKKCQATSLPNLRFFEDLQHYEIKLFDKLITYINV